MQVLKPVVLVVLCSMCLAAAPEREYEVRLHRPDEVGMKFDVLITAALKREASQVMGERSKPSREQVIGLELRARAEILEVDEKGNDTKISFKVEKCVYRIGEQDRELIAPGKTFIAAAGDQGAELTLDGKKMPEEKARLLGMALDLSKWYGFTADDIYGTPKRQKIGSSWTINQENLLKQAKKRASWEESRKTEGTLKLVGVTRIEGEECLRIFGQVKTTHGEGKEEDGVRRISGTYEAEETMLVPVDPDSRRSEFHSTDVSKSLHESKQRGRTVKLEQTTTRIVNLRAIPVK